MSEDTAQKVIDTIIGCYALDPVPFFKARNAIGKCGIATGRWCCPRCGKEWANRREWQKDRPHP